MSSVSGECSVCGELSVRGSISSVCREWSVSG